MEPKIQIIKEKITSEKLREFLNQPFEDMVKFVVDIKKGIIALGGEMHADAEEILLHDGSSQSDLWGANIYPDAEEKIQYESLINIRPSQGNNSMEIKDEGLKSKIADIVNQLIQF